LRCVLLYSPKSSPPESCTKKILKSIITKNIPAKTYEPVDINDKKPTSVVTDTIFVRLPIMKKNTISLSRKIVVLMFYVFPHRKTM